MLIFLKSRGFSIILLVSLFILSAIPKMNAQSSWCGMTDENQATIMHTGNVQYVAGTLNQTFQIPLHVFIFNDDSGESPHAQGYAIESIFIGVNRANQVFPSEFEFFICKIDEINNTDLYNAGSQTLGGNFR